MALLVSIRIAFLVWAPLELVGDEAYYWDWGRQPAWGYYSKPPMIAWLMGATHQLIGTETWMVRAPAVLFTTGSLVMSCLLAGELFGKRVARAFVLALALAPAAVAQNLIFTIDAPLLFFWSTALWSFWRWHGAQPRPHRWGFAAIATVSLAAGHLTKQMMWVFPVIAAVFLASSARTRRRLWSPDFLTIALGGFLGLIPWLLWNSQHGWITFQHTTHHFSSRSINPLAITGRLIELIVGEILIIGPVIGVMAAGCFWQLLRGPRNQGLSPAERLLWFFSMPALIVMLLMGLRQSINLNWPLVFLGPLVLLTIRRTLANQRDGKWLNRGLLASGILSAAGYVYAFGAPLLGFAGTSADLTARLRGWQALSTAVEPWREAGRGEDRFLLTVGHRYMTSQLAFHLAGQPRTYRWPLFASIESQYEVWNQLPEQSGRDALIVHQVSPDCPELPAALRETFQSVSRVHSVTISLGASRVRHFDFYVGHQFQYE